MENATNVCKSPRCLLEWGLSPLLPNHLSIRHSFGGECFYGLEDVLGDDELFCDCSMAKDSDGRRYGKCGLVPS